ncbi:MAG: putative Na+/H+ antiporter [Bacteriovoracaceae bacterium]|nr:putative Na+/H+ antiporter [Bacteriovoracaceae bacterium]
METTSPTTLQLVGTIMFVLAVLHTFLVKKFAHIAHKYPQGSVGENFFHFMAEVEVVFGFWAGLFILFMYFQSFLHSIAEGFGHAMSHAAHESVVYLESLNFTEPAFVFVIMAMAGTRPIIKLSEKMIVAVSKLIPIPGRMAFYISTLVMGPLLGSFITEPAAMTVTAIILLKNFYSKEMSLKFKYATIGLLFVNVSIGGTLTYFAAPPVLMVAQKWGFDQDFFFMIKTFGYKAAIVVFLSAIGTAIYFKKELQGAFELRKDNNEKMLPPWWVTFFHVFFLFLVVFHSHHMVAFLGLFLFFLGFTKVTDEYQDSVKLKESLLVGFFLGGLVTLGAQQQWWLQPLITSMDSIALFLGATGLTAITDNAALTYLGSLVEGLSDTSKYYLVAGAVTGGGLTVIANAPNPAGYGILKDSFGSEGVSPLGLLVAGIAPTLLALLAFHFLPNL